MLCNKQQTINQLGPIKYDFFRPEYVFLIIWDCQSVLSIVRSNIQSLRDICYDVSCERDKNPLLAIANMKKGNIPQKSEH